MLNETFREVVRLAATTQLSARRIARLLDVAPNTVLRVVKILRKRELTWAELQGWDDMALRGTFYPRSARWNERVEPDWAEVHGQMQEKYQTLLEVWERYRREHPGSAYAYSQFTALYRKFVSKVDLTMRQVHYAGECVYVDFAGGTIPWTDPKTGVEHHAQVFIAALGCSNYTFAYATRSQKVEDWVHAHNRMFAFYGGVTQALAPDNLRSAVTRPGIDPVLNRTYLELARHYSVAVVPARVRRPQDKAKAEAAVLMFSRWCTVSLRRRKFFSIDEINVAIEELLQRLNERPFKRLPGCRRSRFEALDKPALQPLPARPFEYAEWVAEQKVGPDYHVWVNDHAYSVPFSLVGERVEARVSARMVEVLHRNRRVAAHARSFETGLHTTDPNHRPPAHAAYAAQTPERFQRWARSMGPNTRLAVTAQFDGKPDYSMVSRRACSQLQMLARTYGPDRFEAACARAAAINSLTVKSIRSILQRRLDEAVPDDLPVQAQLPLHANVRGPEYYRAEGV